MYVISRRYLSERDKYIEQLYYSYDETQPKSIMDNLFYLLIFCLVFNTLRMAYFVKESCNK